MRSWQFRYLTLSETVPYTSELFCVATSDSFLLASVMFSVNFEAPIENADQLYKNIRHVIHVGCTTEMKVSQEKFRQVPCLEMHLSFLLTLVRPDIEPS